jgi:hypothetical protein
MMCRGDTWPALIATLRTIGNTNALKDVHISALEVQHNEWTNHVWSAALARLDQQLKLVAFTGLKRLAINISFHEIDRYMPYQFDPPPPPPPPPPPMPIATDRGILYFTFNDMDDSLAFREYEDELCRHNLV